MHAAPKCIYTFPKDCGILSLAFTRKPLGHRTSQFFENNQSAEDRNYLKPQVVKQMLDHWHQNKQTKRAGSFTVKVPQLHLPWVRRVVVCRRLKYSLLYIPGKLIPLTSTQNSIILFLYLFPLDFKTIDPLYPGVDLVSKQNNN